MRTPFLLFFSILLLGGCAGGEDDRPAESTYLNLAPDVDYVGKEACGSCHGEKFETFTEAQMGRSFKPALLAHSAARWEDVPPVYDESRDLYYQAFHRGDSLYVMEFRIAEGDTVHKRVEKIDYIVGSGQHTNSHIMEVNGYLYQMPMTWYAQKGHWDLPPGFDNNNSRFGRPITQACMGCHNAVADFVPGSENRFESVPHGIDCERCHGPGALHVQQKRAGELVDVRSEIDYTIVNPAKLPIERQFDVCQRCHMQGATVYEPGMDPYDFRPGMTLDSVLNVFTPRYSDSTENFIMASHPDRLQMSECFLSTHEDGSPFEPMTCTTCHDPHLPIEALGADHYQSVCQSCHIDEQAAAPASAAATAQAAHPTAPTVQTATLATDEFIGQDARVSAPRANGKDRSRTTATVSGQFVATRPSAGACTAPEDLRLSLDNDCAACHMPKSGSTDIPHVSITDHFIRVAEPTESDVEVSDDEFVGLASLIKESATLQERAEGYMTYFEEITNIPHFLDSAGVFLDRAARRTSRAAVASSLIRYHFLREDYEAMVELAREVDLSQVADGWSFYRLGHAHAATGETDRALAFIERAVEFEPQNLRFRNRLGVAYSAVGRFEEARTMFDAVIQANPLYADAYNNRGFALAMLGDLASAERDFLKALELNPDAYQAMANLASLYVNRGEPAKARPYVERLISYDPTHPGYLQLQQLTR